MCVLFFLIEIRKTKLSLTKLSVAVSLVEDHAVVLVKKEDLESAESVPVHCDRWNSARP